VLGVGDRSLLPGGRQPLGTVIHSGLSSLWLWHDFCIINVVFSVATLLGVPTKLGRSHLPHICGLTMRAEGCRKGNQRGSLPVFLCSQPTPLWWVDPVSAWLKARQWGSDLATALIYWDHRRWDVTKAFHSASIESTGLPFGYLYLIRHFTLRHWLCRWCSLLRWGRHSVAVHLWIIRYSCEHYGPSHILGKN